MIKNPVNVTVTGAADNIGYVLLLRIASGAMLGADQPVRIKVPGVPPALKAAEGTMMELDDYAFPLLTDIDITDDAGVALEGCNFGLLVGSMPRKKGMKRADLISANGGIFGPQGRAINDYAADDVRILVVGNPASTSVVIVTASTPDVSTGRFNVMMRPDHNRAISQLAGKTGAAMTDIRKMIMWGSHSVDQYPDVSFYEVTGKATTGLVDGTWLDGYFVPTVTEHGTAIIEVRGASSAALAALAVINRMHSWVLGTPADDWITAAVPSHGEYGMSEGLSHGLPVTPGGKAWKTMEGLELSTKTKGKIAFNTACATEKIDTVKPLGILQVLGA